MTNYSGPLFLNRMRPPWRLGPLIKRTGLLERLEQRNNAHLVIIHGPAGYGKTVLLTQCHEWLQAQARPCSWLTIDETDADPVQFLAYLVASLDSTALIPGDILESAFNGFHGLEEKDAFNVAVNCLASLRDPVHILLDDYHLLPEGSARRLVAKLLGLTFDNIRFIIASRRLPVSLKGRMQLSGSFFELTTPDLALSREETRDFLDLSKRTNATDEFVALLHEKTEGWAAAIEFVKIWLDKNTENALADFINQSVDFNLFIQTEIFNQLPQKLQDAMVKMSVVDDFDGELINEVCELNDGWRLLEELFQQDLIIPLDKTSNRYRHHYLLAGFFRNLLREKSDAEKRKLHKLASRRRLKTGNSAEALKHAIACNEPELIAAVIEQSGGWRLVLDGRISTFATALEHLPPDALQRSPRTRLGDIALTAKLGDIAAALKKHHEFRRDTLNFTSLNGRPLSSDFAVEANVVDFFLGGLEDRPQTPQYIGKMESTLKGLAKNEHFLRARLLNYLSYGYFDSGNYEKAYQAGEEAISHRRRLRSIYGENYLYFHLGKICLAQGRLRDAEQLYHEGRQLAVDNFGGASDMAAIACAHLAEIAYEKNELRQAQTYLETTLPKLEDMEAWFDVYISAYLTAAKIADILKDGDSAEEILLKAANTGKRRNLPRLRFFALSRRIRLMVKKGQLAKANRIISRLQLEKLTSGREFVNHRLAEEIGSTIAYCLIESGQAQDAVKIVDNLLATAKRNKCRRSLMALQILAALARFKLGKHKQALAKLSEAVSLAIFEGFKRPFLEYGRSQQEMLETALSGAPMFPINRLKRSFLTELANTISREIKNSGRHSPELFTPKEQEILKHVCDGCSNKEIARNCDCSENTVKFHLKNIFAKLGVNDRKAVARATWERQGTIAEGPAGGSASGRSAPPVRPRQGPSYSSLTSG